MTLESHTPATPTRTTASLKLEQHHSKAAEYLEHAAKSHKEVAKLTGTNDHAGAQAPAKVAHAHLTQAQTHAGAATKATTAVK
jgi:hypothetical protein